MLFRGWSTDMDQVSPHCMHCDNPVVICGTKTMSSAWVGTDMSLLDNAFLVACKAGHITGSAIIPVPGLDATMDKGYEAVNNL